MTSLLQMLLKRKYSKNEIGNEEDLGFKTHSFPY